MEFSVIYSIAATISLVASFIIPHIVMSSRMNVVTAIMASVTVFVAWLFNPVSVFSSPVYFDEALAYYAVLAIVGLYLFVSLVRRLHRKSGTGMLSQKTDRPLQLVGELRNRARVYRIESKVSLGIIMASLIGGAVIFVRADAIAARNVSQRINSVADSLVTAQSRQRSISAVHDNIRDVIDSIKKEVPFDRAAVKKEYEKLTAHIAALEPLQTIDIDDFLDHITHSQEDRPIQTVISSLSTRIGSVFLIVFLVKILTNLFRYSVRMAAHFESRADILSLEDVSDDRAAELLRTDTIDFDKMPKAPTKEVKDVILEILRAVAPKTPGL